MNNIDELKNIIDEFNGELFNQYEIDDIMLSMCSMIDNYLNTNPLDISNYNFDNNLDLYVIYNLLPFIKNVCNTKYTTFDDDEILFELEIILSKVKKIYFSKFYPIRSYDKSFIRKIPNTENIKEKITAIKNKPSITTRCISHKAITSPKIMEINENNRI